MPVDRTDVLDVPRRVVELGVGSELGQVAGVLCAPG